MLRGRASSDRTEVRGAQGEPEPCRVRASRTTLRQTGTMQRTSASIVKVMEEEEYADWSKNIHESLLGYIPEEHIYTYIPEEPQISSLS